MTVTAISELRLCPGVEVLCDDNIPARNERDWNSQVATRPLAVVRPTTPEGVASVLRICSTHGIAVVPQGGLTGLCGGAQPSSDCVALSLERMVGVEELDPVAGTATVRAGTTLAAIQKAAEEAGLYCGLDIGSRGSCTIGGNLSTNAGGNRVIRYGMARQMVLGLEVALADGTLMTSLNKMLKNNAGYDLKHLFIGSEGTLGVITRAVLRLSPLPASTSTAMCALKDFGSVLRLLDGARRRLGPSLSAFEVMWQDFFDVATSRVPGIRSPFSETHAFFVLLEAQGIDADSDATKFEGWLGEQLEEGVLEDAVIAQSLSEADAFWTLRDAGSEFASFMGPFAGFDIGLPVNQIDAYVQDCRRTMAKELPGCLTYFLGHIADGNIHIVAYVPGAEMQPFSKIDEIVYRLVQQYGGTISAEHGIGTKKKKYLAFSRSPEELALMRMLKTTLDPKGILNPGKVL